MPPTHLDSFVPPPPVGRRAEVLAGLTRAIVEQESSRRLVIAIDGVDGAGKTVLALELADMLAPHREVSRASIDGFHRPRAQRYARGRTAESFYRDSYDHGAIRTLLVEPFRAGAPWRRAVYDVQREMAVEAPPEPGSGRSAVLLVDGIFLHRPELDDLWDASIWVEVPFEVSVPRGNARFGEVDALGADPASEGNARYVGGQRLYLADVDPVTRATWVLDNTDLAAPVLLTGPLDVG